MSVAVLEPAAVTRPALRYHGAKWRLAPWILAHLPPHEVYVEPYGGSGAILLRKAPAPLEVLNDLSRDVAVFWRVLRDRTDELLWAIQCTPFSREEVELARDEPDESVDDLERARRFYVLSWQCIHGAPRSGQQTGWRLMKHPAARGVAVDDWQRLGHLGAVAARLRTVQLERRPALEVIRRMDSRDCLVFADPPYLTSTRGRRWQRVGYAGQEMDGAAHRELAAVLRACTGMVVLSGYPSALYDELYGDWERVTTRAMTQSSLPATECLWRNPAAVARARGQLDLFAAPPGAGE